MKSSAAVFTAMVTAGVIALTGCSSSGKATGSQGSSPAPRTVAPAAGPLTPAQLASALTAAGVCDSSHTGLNVPIAIEETKLQAAGVKTAGGIECLDDQANPVVDIYGFADPASERAAAELARDSNGPIMYGPKSSDATWIVNVSTHDQDLATKAEQALSAFSVELASGSQ